MYVNTFIVCDMCIHCRTGPAVLFRSSCFNGQAAEYRSYAALIGLVAVFAHIGAPVQSRVFTAFPAPNGLAAM